MENTSNFDINDNFFSYKAGYIELTRITRHILMSLTAILKSRPEHQPYQEALSHIGILFFELDDCDSLPQIEQHDKRLRVYLEALNMLEAALDAPMSHIPVTTKALNNMRSIYYNKGERKLL